MIQQKIIVREEFRDKVEEFCISNNIEWGPVCGECCCSEGVHGTPEQVKKVEDYIKELETEGLEYRSTKSIWWRIWN